MASGEANFPLQAGVEGGGEGHWGRYVPVAAGEGVQVRRRLVNVAQI
jgi:hypothetical protein